MELPNYFDAILGGEFAEHLRVRVKAGRWGRKTLKTRTERVEWMGIVRAIESVKGEKRERFRDRYGDWGCDAALYLAPRQGRKKLRELAGLAGGIDYAAVGGATSRFSKRLAQGDLKREMKRILTQLSKS